MHLGELARLRQGAYRLFAQSLLYPDGRRLEALAAVAGELRGQSDVRVPFAFFREWDRFLRSVETLCHEEKAAIQGEYVSNFVANRLGVPCPIYESAYMDEGPSATGWVLAELEREYADMGLAPSSREPADHAAVELEFMAFLCSQEAAAWEEQDLPPAVQTFQRERGFLRRHLAWWLPRLAARVAATTDPHSVFATGTRATEAFLVHDGDLLDTLVQRFEGVEETA